MTSKRLEEFLLKSADLYPDKTAIDFNQETITYKELLDKAKNIAFQLLAKRQQRGDRVAILIDKSIDAISAMYGALLADCVYVPIDMSQPKERINKIISDCGANHLIINSPQEDLQVTGRHLLDLNRLNHCTQTLPARESELAYILYTSGSTGIPKGVKITHKNAVNFVQWVVNTFQLSHNERFANHANLFFDISVLDIYCACAVGATVCLLPNFIKMFPIKVADWIMNKKITIWYSVPTALINLTNHGRVNKDTFSNLRYIFFAGEVYPYDELFKLNEHLTQTTLVNLYGPTETNVCSYFILPNHLSDLPNHEIPIGFPISNTNLFMLDENNNIRDGEGLQGELCCVGDCVSPGYWDATLSDNKKFQEFKINGETHFGYRTGDLVKKTSNGYVYISRIDRQIKLHGFRIDPLEIETALRSFDQIENAVIVSQSTKASLIAFVVLKSHADSLDSTALVNHMVNLIPKYMLPEKYIVLNAIPLTPNGKIDYKDLQRHAEILLAP